MGVLFALLVYSFPVTYAENLCIHSPETLLGTAPLPVYAALRRPNTPHQHEDQFRSDYFAPAPPQESMDKKMDEARRANPGPYFPMKIEVRSYLPAGHNIVKDLAEEAARYLESALSVRKTKGTPKNYVKGSPPCKELSLDQEKSTDRFIMLVKLDDQADSKCMVSDKLQAQAVACSSDDTGRPQAGALLICPRAAEGAKLKQQRSNLLATLKHEMLHTLGFSQLFLKKNESVFVKDPDKGTYYEHDELVISEEWSRTVFGGETYKHTVLLVATPMVKKKVREHFACEDLAGAPLEDQGPKGTVGSHWDKRVFGNEIMAGTQTSSSSFSAITFALLEDTGWYKVDYTGMGCDFVKKGCGYWIQKNVGDVERLKPFCQEDDTQRKSKRCRPDRTAIVQCNVKKYPHPLPKEYRYFKDPNIGGAVDLADYCPTFQDYIVQTTKPQRDSSCQFVENQVPFDSRKKGENVTSINTNLALEVFGEQSMCVDIISRQVKKQIKNHKGLLEMRFSKKYAGCYKIICEGENGRYRVEISNGNGVGSSHLATCYATDQALHVNREVKGGTYKFSLKCPPCNVVCPKQKCAPDDITKANKTYDVLSNSQNVAAFFLPIFTVAVVLASFL